MAFIDLCQQKCLRVSGRCYRYFSCLADPDRRSSLGLKLVLVILHLVYAGVLFLFDKDLIGKTRKEPWYPAFYVLLFISTLLQYFITACSSPGYVLDAMGAVNQTNSSFTNDCKQRQAASNKNGSVVVTVDDPLRKNLFVTNLTSWSKTVMDLYPPGTPARNYICTYCNVERPPRAKHCHDCGQCILKFDHHCTWLGTCIGYRNHCRFWWYICEEAALCLWTAFLYITYLRANISRTWWKSAIMITLLIFLLMSLIFLLLLLLFHSYLILTNQTTYELVRRRRISYFRMVSDREQVFHNDFQILWNLLYDLLMKCQTAPRIPIHNQIFISNS